MSGEGGRNRNEVWGRALVEELVRSGVREVCVAPGSRSTPLVLAVAGEPRLRAFVHLDERSAAFFALGIGKATGRPAAVITTSGTATANLLPAVVEASWSEAPLLLLTADRPRRLRDADANQAIDQVGLYGRYTRAFFDLAPPAVEGPALRHLRTQAARAVAAARGPVPGPVHLNVPLAKPLEPVSVPGDVPDGFAQAHPRAWAGRGSDAPWVRVTSGAPAAGSEAVEEVAGLLRGAGRGLLVAGPAADPALGPAMLRLASASGCPLLADPLSGARWGPAGGAVVVAHYDLFLRDAAVREALRPDVVVRVGASPTSASLLALLEEAGDARQVVIDPGGRWKDHLAVATDYLEAAAAPAVDALAGRVGGTVDPGWRGAWEAADAGARDAVAAAARGGFFEGTAVALVAEAVPEGGTLLVSNSMPVRDLDAFSPPGPGRRTVLGNRGASGIDGIVSTALGAAAGSGERVVAVLGDLAFYHDMNGLLATRYEDAEVVFVVIHNDGGGIFHMLPIREHEPHFTRFFATPHGLDFRHAADLYGLPFRRVADRGGLEEALREALGQRGSRIVEVRTDRERNRKRHEEVAEEVVGAVRTALGCP